MAKPNPTPVAPAPQAVIILGGSEPCQLRWDKAAMFRADECGVFTTKGVGFAKAAKYVWAMLPINAAIKAAGEGMSPKNVYGSTSGRSPSSS
jgi:hypothetical protein